MFLPVATLPAPPNSNLHTAGQLCCSANVCCPASSCLKVLYASTFAVYPMQQHLQLVMAVIIADTQGGKCGRPGVYTCRQVLHMHVPALEPVWVKYSFKCTWLGYAEPTA